jgi:hypothetical protein
LLRIFIIWKYIFKSRYYISYKSTTEPLTGPNKNRHIIMGGYIIFYPYMECGSPLAYDTI